MNKEIKTARNWYIWLWISPIFTLPTLLMVLFTYSNSSYTLPSELLVLVPALWHLVLLIPALSKQSEFVRWHGRQALLLAGLRTAMAVFISALSGIAGITLLACVISPILILIIALWFFGTWWGVHQAGKGDCALMRWVGRGDALPLSTETDDYEELYLRGLALSTHQQTDDAIKIFAELLSADTSIKLKRKVVTTLNLLKPENEKQTADVLVAIFRFGPDQEEHGLAFKRLKELGFVESL